MKHIFFHHISLAPLCKEHLDQLALSLRKEDRAEMWAAYRLPARQGLEFCFQRSAFAVAFLYQGRVAAAAGVEGASLLGQRGCVWSWTGEAVDKCPKSFCRASAVVLALFKSRYPQLFAACDQRYFKARRYLRHLGARPTGDKIGLTGPETRFVLYRF